MNSIFMNEIHVLFYFISISAQDISIRSVITQGSLINRTRGEGQCIKYGIDLDLIQQTSGQSNPRIRIDASQAGIVDLTSERSITLSDSYNTM